MELVISIFPAVCSFFLLLRSKLLAQQPTLEHFSLCASHNQKDQVLYLYNDNDINLQSCSHVIQNTLLVIKAAHLLMLLSGIIAVSETHTKKIYMFLGYGLDGAVF
jgi:hypothetical protein